MGDQLKGLKQPSLIFSCLPLLWSIDNGQDEVESGDKNEERSIIISASVGFSSAPKEIDNT